MYSILTLITLKTEQYEGIADWYRSHASCVMHTSLARQHLPCLASMSSIMEVSSLSRLESFKSSFSPPSWVNLERWSWKIKFDIQECNKGSKVICYVSKTSAILKVWTQGLSFKYEVILGQSVIDSSCLCLNRIIKPSTTHSLT